MSLAENATQSQPLLAEICRLVDDLEPSLIELRQELHRYPEISGQEFETTRRLAGALSAHQIPFHVSPTERGLVCEVLEANGSDESAPGILLRGDIDALPIQDQKSTDYRSRCPGLMHACGHDAHAVIVLGATVALSTILKQGQLTTRGRVRSIFQPAEEICEGAQQMISEGVTNGIDAALAVHVDPSRTYGQFGFREGTLTAICDELVIEIRGRGGHGARPHLSRDPIAAATRLVQSAYSQIPRSLNPQWPHVLSFCEIRSGHSANVIPDHALIRGTLRTVDRESRDKALSSLSTLCQTTAVQTECDIRFRTGVHSPAVCNDPELTQLMIESARALTAGDQIRPIPFPSMGGEDFAFYGAHCATAMARLGSRPPDSDAMDLHSATFDIDERVLALGAKFLAWSSVLWLRRHGG